MLPGVSLQRQRGSSQPKFFSFPVSSLISHILVLKCFRLTVSSTSFLLLKDVRADFVDVLELGYARSFRRLEFHVDLH